MPQNPRWPSVSIDLARILIRYASDRGFDGLKIWQDAGLDRHLFQSGDARLSARHFDVLWRAAEHEIGDDDFGLRLGRAFKDYAGGHLLYAVLMNSPTVEKALGKFCRYHCILSNVVHPRLIDTGKTPKITLDTSYPKVMLGRGQEAFILSLFAAIIDKLTGSRDNITEVRFSHPPPENIDFYHRIFECPMKFHSRESALLVARSAMDKSVFLANPELLSKLEIMALRHAGQLSIENTVRYKVALVLSRILANGDKPSIGAIAKALALSTRLLQQKLKNEQTSYRELLSQVRKETAIRLLEDRENTITDITFILGFSEQSSFTHAFLRWTGTTPGQYRKRSRKKIKRGQANNS